MRTELERDLTIAKAYFEEMIGCVVGCGCWDPGWDRADLVAAFARDGFSWRDAWTPREVLAALERVSELAPDEVGAAAAFLELHLDDLGALRAFWAPSIAALRASLSP